MAASQDVDASDLELCIKSILISTPTVITANALQNTLCKEELNGPFPLRKLGFRTFVDYLRSIPHVVKLDPPNSFNPNVYPVVSQATRHIDQLVSRQRIPTSKKRGVSRRGAFNSRPPAIRRRPISSVASRPAPLVRPNQGIDVRDLESNLRRNYDQRDLARNGIHCVDDLFSRVEGMVERGDTKVYPKLAAGSNRTNHSQTNCIPAGLEDDFDDDFFDYEYYEDDEKDSEEELSNEAIKLWSKALGEKENDSPPSPPVPEDKNSVFQGDEEKLNQNVDISENNSNISDAMIRNFRYILSQYPDDGIWASQLQQLYYDHFHVSLDLQELDHTSVMSLAASLPSVFSYCREGSHDWKLYDARYVPQETLDAQVNGGGNTLPENERYIPQTIIEKIKNLLDEHPGGFRSTNLLQIYMDTFHKPLNLDALGFNTLDEFLMILKNDITLKKVFNYYLLLPKHKFVSHEALLPPKPEERLNVPAESLALPIPEDVFRLGEEIPLQELPEVQMDPDKPLLELEVRVAEVISPVFFYITLGKMYEELEKMMDDLEKFYSWEEANFKIPLPHIVMNLYCAAKYCDYWHRAKITRLRSNGSVEIEYIDYGTPATVKSSELRYLSKEFAYLPAQAICAKLLGIKPLNEASRFPPEVCSRFLSLVENKRLVAHVYHVSERERMQLEVILFDVENPDQETVINDFLVENGLACSILQGQDSPPQESPPEVQLSNGNILPENDLTSLQTNNPSLSLASGENLSAENNFSTHFSDALTSLPASSNAQTEKITIGPPPGFKDIHNVGEPVIHLSTLNASTTPMQSSSSKPASLSLEDQQSLMINNFFMMDGNLVLQEQYRNLYKPNPSNMPLTGSPLFQSQQNGNHHCSLTYGSIVPPTNAFHNHHYRQHHNYLPVPSNYVQMRPVPVQMLQPVAPGFWGTGVLMNPPVPNQYMQFCPPNLPPNLVPSNVQGYGQGDFLFTSPTDFNKTKHTPPLSTSHPRSSPSPTPSTGYTPVTVPEWPPKNLPSFTSVPTGTKVVSCSHHSLPSSPQKSKSSEDIQLNRPHTPLTPASAEVANICELSRPSSATSRKTASPQRQTKSPTLVTSQSDTNPLDNLLSSPQVVENSFENAVSNFKIDPIDFRESSVTTDGKGREEPETEVKDGFLTPDAVKRILLRSPGAESFYSTVSSPVDSLIRNSPPKEESSDDHVSASELVEEAKHELANLLLTEKCLVPASKVPCDTVDDIPDSWENLDLDDTPAKADNFSVDFSQPLDLIIKNMENKSTVKTNDPVETSRVEVKNQEAPLKLQAPVNWKDFFNPDIISITESDNNNTVKDKSFCASKLEVKKIPIQKIEIQGKSFHLLYLRNETPAVVALEFFKQFTSSNSPQVSEKVVEVKHNKMYYISKMEYPAILTELDKLQDFGEGLPKKSVIRLNKVRVLNLSDIPECLQVLNVLNKPLLDDLQKVAKKLVS